MTAVPLIPAAALPPHRHGLAGRLVAAFDAFLAPERLLPAGAESFGAGNDGPVPAELAASLVEPLALPPNWSAQAAIPRDLLSLSFLPFER